MVNRKLKWYGYSHVVNLQQWKILKHEENYQLFSKI